MKRALKPRATVAAYAAFVSQLTSLLLLGVDPRRYLDLVVPLCRGHVTELGKLRLIPLDVAVEALRSLANAEPAAPVADTDDEAPTRDAILARIGRCAAGGGR